MRLTVLSPHRDDAAFSLALAMKRWSAAGAEITILNFFTESDYAPHASRGCHVSSLRAREDRRSANAVDKRIRMSSLYLLDGPLRLSVDFGSITNPDVCSPLPAEVAQLARRIRTQSFRSLILAPLALGEHIDHRTVHQAAIEGATRYALGFYEDLPYAAWTDEAVIRERVAMAADRLQISIFPALQRSDGWRFKERVARKYASQIDLPMARSIARYSEKFGGAERIWIPLHSLRWRRLLEAKLA